MRIYSQWNSIATADFLIVHARIMNWVASPFSRRSPQPRGQTQVSHIAGGFFTSWATREAQEYPSGLPIPFPADLPDPGNKPGSPALQADSLPTGLSRKPIFHAICELIKFLSLIHSVKSFTWILFSRSCMLILLSSSWPSFHFLEPHRISVFWNPF